jgi:hypothetical protein
VITDVPFFKATGLKRALTYPLRGWRATSTISAQSGRPLTIDRAVDQSGTGTYLVAPSDRPDQIANPFVAGPVLQNPDPACHTTTLQGGRAAAIVRDASNWFNPCAFAPAPGRFGNAGRNSLIGPGLFDADVSLLKNVVRTETRSLQLRAEMFNVLNHPNFDLPDRTFDSPTFGKIRSANAYGTRPPRQIQFAVRYTF